MAFKRMRTTVYTVVLKEAEAKSQLCKEYGIWRLLNFSILPFYYKILLTLGKCHWFHAMASDEVDDECFGGQICHAFVFWEIAS